VKKNRKKTNTKTVLLHNSFRGTLARRKTEPGKTFYARARWAPQHPPAHPKNKKLKSVAVFLGTLNEQTSISGSFTTFTVLDEYIPPSEPQPG
jgi:hypothetical protein